MAWFQILLTVVQTIPSVIQIAKLIHTHGDACKCNELKGVLANLQTHAQYGRHKAS